MTCHFCLWRIIAVVNSQCGIMRQCANSEINGSLLIMSFFEVSSFPAAAVIFPSEHRRHKVYITASEFADILMELVDDDPSIQSLIKAV